MLGGLAFLFAPLGAGAVLLCLHRADVAIGLRALSVYVLVGVLVWAIKEWVTSLWAGIALLLVVAAASVQPSVTCSACYPGAWLEFWLSLGAILAVCVCLPMLLLSPAAGWFRNLALAVCVSGVACECVAQDLAPRLCVGCLGLLVCLECTYWVAAYRGEPRARRRFVSSAGLIVLGLLTPTAARLGLGARAFGMGGILPTEFIGLHAGDVPGLGSADGAYMITLPGCPVCEKARSFIGAHRWHVREVPVCTVARESACIDVSKYNLVAPTMLIVRSGVVADQASGWPLPSGFMSELMSVAGPAHAGKE